MKNAALCFLLLSACIGEDDPGPYECDPETEHCKGEGYQGDLPDALDAGPELDAAPGSGLRLGPPLARTAQEWRALQFRQKPGRVLAESEISNCDRLAPLQEAMPEIGAGPITMLLGGSCAGWGMACNLSSPPSNCCQDGWGCMARPVPSNGSGGTVASCCSCIYEFWSAGVRYFGCASTAATCAAIEDNGCFLKNNAGVMFNAGSTFCSKCRNVDPGNIKYHPQGHNKIGFMCGSKGDDYSIPEEWD